MTENERLKELQKILGFKSQCDFAAALGIKQGTLSGIYMASKGVGVSGNIKRILENQYGVNIDWLETGEGSVIKGDGNQNVNGNHNTAIQGNGNQVNSETTRFLALLEKKDEQIDRLLAIIESVTNK